MQPFLCHEEGVFWMQAALFQKHDMRIYLGLVLARVSCDIPALPALEALIGLLRPPHAGQHGVRIGVADRLEVARVVRP